MSGSTLPTHPSTHPHGPSRPRTAVVIGGGIAGPVTAIALQKAGIDATVYEAYEHTADGIGGLLSIAPNGLAALAVIGADEPVRRAGEPVTAMVLQSWNGKRLAEFSDPAGAPLMNLMWRADLYRALYDEATARGVRIVHGKRLTGLDDTATGVVARFADGSTAVGDILVGADGINSTVRSLIDPAAPAPSYTGLLGLGGVTCDTGVPSTGDAFVFAFGKRAFFGYKVYDDGRAMWFVNMPNKTRLSFEEANATPNDEWLRRIREAFAGDRMPAPRILERARAEDMIITGGTTVLPPVPVWHKGRVVLAGDAAACPSHSSGQGASMAMESAVHLARCLRDLPVPDAFAAYRALREPRIARITAAAQRTNSDKAAGPVARVIRDLTMPVAMKFVRPGSMAWQFDYRIDWDAPATVAAAA